MTLSTSHWGSVQDKGSKILCGKLGALKITPNDFEALWEMEGRCWPAGVACGRECMRRSSVLLLNLSGTAATSQDGSSLEFIAAIAGRQCFIQDASGRGMWPLR